MKRRIILAATAALLSAGLAVAHGPKGTKTTGTHGGDIVDVDGGHLELVAQPAELIIYLTDLKDAPATSDGLTARAIVQDGSKQAILPLSPKEPNMLVAPLAAPLGKDTKVAISTALTKGGKPVQARFVIK